MSTRRVFPVSKPQPSAVLAEYEESIPLKSQDSHVNQQNHENSGFVKDNNEIKIEMGSLHDIKSSPPTSERRLSMSSDIKRPVLPRSMTLSNMMADGRAYFSLCLPGSGGSIFPLAPTNLNLVLLSVGIFIFFVINGYVEESLFHKYPDFKYGWYLTTWELLFFSLFAMIQRILARESRVFVPTVPLKYHALVALAVTFARGLTNISMQLLNYPTMVIFKSLKLITVMLGASIMNGKRFLVREYIAAIFLATSAAMFSLGDAESSTSKSGPTFNTYGVVVVLVSLAFDSIQANAQERILKGCPVTEAIMFSNSISALLSFLWTVVSGEFGFALEFCSLNPETYLIFFYRAVVCYLGVACLLMQMQLFGAVVANVVTSVRKIVTILFSFFIFGHAVTKLHFIGLLFFIAAAGLNEFLKPFLPKAPVAETPQSSPDNNDMKV